MVCRRTINCLIFAGLVLAGGCSQRTTVMLQHESGADIEAEIDRLMGMCEVEVRSVSVQDAQTKVVLETVVSETSRELIGRMLDRAVEVSGNPDPVNMKLIIEEEDTSTLSTLGLSPGQEFSVLLDIDNAQRNLKELKTEYGAQRFCTYDIPVSGNLPNLSYTQSFQSSGANELVSKLNEMFANIPMTAEHRVEFTNHELDPVVQRMSIMGENEVSFVFDTTEGGGGFFEGTAYSREFTDCTEEIVRKCPDSFYGQLMFPKLSAALSSYEIKTAFTL